MAETPARLPQTRPDPAPEERESEALVLIRAMVHAAKADGRLTRDEQRAIYDQLGSRSADASRFLQREFDQPTNARDFAWSVPLGMEYKVYAISLSAIDLDSKSESEYLAELAHGLRLPEDVCRHLHQRYGAPSPR